MEPLNPYEAPTASVTRAPETGRAGIGAARRVPAGHGGSWLNKGFVAIGQSVAGWLLVFLVMLIPYGASAGAAYVLQQFNYFLGILPSLLTNPAIMIIWGGIMYACHQGPLTFANVVRGARNNWRPLAVLGLALTLMSAIMMLPVGALGLTSLIVDGQSDGISFSSIALLAVTWIVLMVLFMAAYWFAPQLIVVGHIAPIKAMQMSFKASFKNTLAFVVFVLLAIVLLLAAFLLMAVLLAVGIGVFGFVASFDGGAPAGIAGGIFGGLIYVVVMFVMMTVTWAAQYASFRDVFLSGD